MPNEVILLVGGNPLPNYVAAHALRCTHEIERVHLLYTKEVEDVKDNLLRCLTPPFSCRESYISNAGVAPAIRADCSDICGDSHLHYTGGTNTMAVHVHAEWTAGGGKPDQASYLFATDDQLIFDDGTKKSIPSSIQLDLPTLAGLHGLTDAAPRSSGASYTDPQPGDADAIAQRVFCTPKLAQQMYCEVPDRESAFRGKPFDPSAMGLTGLSISGPIPDSSWSNKQIKPWLKFLRGVWLEEWVYQQIKNTSKINCKYLYAGIEPKIKGRPFELDVVAIRGHHLYVVSCTISANTGLCKSKLFEVAMRARQLGGDMARSALVCLAEQSVVDNLQKDVESLSVSSRVPQVFGLDHVREWMGYGGSAPNLTSLSNWLED